MPRPTDALLGCLGDSPARPSARSGVVAVALPAADRGIVLLCPLAHANRQVPVGGEANVDPLPACRVWTRWPSNQCREAGNDDRVARDEFCCDRLEVGPQHLRCVGRVHPGLPCSRQDEAFDLVPIVQAGLAGLLAWVGGWLSGRRQLVGRVPLKEVPPRTPSATFGGMRGGRNRRGRTSASVALGLMAASLSIRVPSLWSMPG